MTKKNLLICLAITTNISLSQNLVPNYSFETFTSCPVSQAQLDLAFPWVMPQNVTGTSDYYNACNTGSQGVPLNVAGYQAAKTGVAYAGVYTYGFDCREYMQVQLTSPMVAGANYKLGMYVSPADVAGYAVDAFGMYVSAGAISGNGTYNPLPYTPQLSSPAGVFLSDTAGWTLLSGNYIATGGENFITIGNFKDDAATQYQVFNSTGWGRGYYFVDDVSVAIDTTTSLYSLLYQNSFLVYPTQFYEALTISPPNNETYSFILYSLTGQKIISRDFLKGNYKFETGDISKGIYFIQLTTSTGTSTGKVVKQ